jgi:DNA-binding HxlR family transcriptional regulator
LLLSVGRPGWAEDGLDLDEDLDGVADDDAAAVHGDVGGDGEVLAVDLGRGREPGTGATEGVTGEPVDDQRQRFRDLCRMIDGISQRMLTVTLRGLERDGLVTRTVHPTVPPRVEYALTPMGHTLLATACTLVQWADDHLPEIDTARAAYDRRADLLEASLNGDPEPISPRRRQ